MELGRLSTEEISTLSKEILIKAFGDQLRYYWYKLPEKFMNDSEVQLYFKRCLGHALAGEDQVDGPAPLLKDCVICIYNDENDKKIQ